MYVLINCSFDGDSYQLFSEVADGVDAFNQSMESGYYHQVYLLKPNVGEEFGFGSRGDIFGAETILEWREDD